MKTRLAPPIARREPTSTTLHGTTLIDEYAWLRQKSSEEVPAHLRAENSYTEAEMEDTWELRKTLYREMLSHIKETDESVPYRDRGWTYWTRTLEGKQYPIYLRRRNEGDAEEVLLDVNALAENKAYMAVGAMAVSPDGELLAYTTDETGFRQYRLHVRDLRTGGELPDTAERVGSVVWAADGTTLFFTTEDEITKRQDRLWRQELGAAATVVFTEADERFNVAVGSSRDRTYLLLECGSHTTNEYRFLPAAEPDGEWRLIAPRIDDQEYHPDHREGWFYLRTNDVTEEFRMVRVRVELPGREGWEEIYRGQAGTPLEDFDVFAGFTVLTERKAGLPVLTVQEIDGHTRVIDFPEPAYSAEAGTNREFVTEVFRYGYTSLVTPASVFEYDVKTGTSRLLKQQEVPGGFEAGRYGSERLWVAAADGVKVPVSVVYRRDRFSGDGSNALYVYGYGSYGFALPVGFGATRLSLLDRGVVMAYAHIRGGGELGDAWHDAGKMMAKRTTFSDFIAVVERLVAGGYGAANRVAIEGGSAGGLLMGAVVNERPELFRAVLSHVPFVDVMHTMLDASLPLTVAEYEEWGNPNEAEAFRYMLGYSPYDNLKEGEYPAMLVKTSLNDSQVMYWEPAKYVAKLRTLKRDDRPLLLHTNMEAGHGGASGRYDYLKEIAFDYAFLLRELQAG